MSHNVPDSVAIRSVHSSSLQSVLSDAVRPFSYQQRSSFVTPTSSRRTVTSKANISAIPPAFHYRDEAGSFSDDGEFYEAEDSYLKSPSPLVSKDSVGSLGKVSALSTNNEGALSLNEGISPFSSDSSVNIDPVHSVQYKSIKGNDEVKKTSSFEPAFEVDNQRGIQPSSKVNAVTENLNHTTPNKRRDSYDSEIEEEVKLAARDGEGLNGKTAIKTPNSVLNNEASSLKALPGEKLISGKKVASSHSVHDVLEWIGGDPAWKQNSSREQINLSALNSPSKPSPASLLQKYPVQKESDSSHNLRIAPLRPDSTKAPLLYRSDAIQPVISSLGREGTQKRATQLLTDRQRTSDSSSNRSTEKKDEPKIQEKIIREVVRVRTVLSSKNQPTRGFAQRSYMTRLLRLRGR